ncbi:acetoacetate decarboxylase (ADC) [Stutzerimonas sp. VN223-3]|uniref:acetoacetate decarboxylase (ADC) n=1 Tax=Stutzerimonas sp. VN223-3 TaxID=3384601 RepID=UPI0038B5536E
MKLGNIVVITGVLLSAATAPSWAEAPLEAAQRDGKTNLGGREVSVAAGGLYDRYQSNPPLSVIAAEAPGIDLSWFKELKKTKVDMGFESYSPNFYYKNSRVTAVFTADIDRLRELMPAEVLKEVRPLQVWPGRGLVAFTAYAYEYCDNDSYNEIALSIVTNKPGRSNLGPVTLIGQSISKDFWGYVLKLPVNTELAEVRGVVGYNLPKWLTGINFRETDKSVVFELIDQKTGKVDVTFEGEKLSDLSDEIDMVTNSFTNIGHDGELAYGYAVSRQQRHASSSNEDSVKLMLSGGSLSGYIESLGLGKMMKYEYVPEFQSALYAPEPLTAMLERD